MVAPPCLQCDADECYNMAVTLLMLKRREQVMPPVTRVVRNTTQPNGGYVNPREMRKVDLESGTKLNPRENISPAMMGLIVDYMSRYALTGDPNDAFKVSLMGVQVMERFAPRHGHRKRALDLLASIDGVNPKSVAAAYQLACYDSAYRIGPRTWVDNSGFGPDAATAQNAVTMVERTVRFVDRFGPIVADGMTFEGGYTDKVTAGDADFCTKDVLWDMKVSKYPPTADHTLQLMMYYLMGRHAECKWAEGIESIGVWNPRLDSAWTKRIDEVDGKVIKAIERDVIGYSS